MSGYGSTAVMGSYDLSHPGFPVPAIPSTPDSGRRTRSGRTILSTQSPSRITKSASRTRASTRNPSPTRNRSPSRARSRSRATTSALRNKPSSSIASRGPQLTLPLSILTADSPIAIRDIASWVNLPASIRQQEALTRNGYVTRPMNSFMLYRSAYAERTKYWGAQNNHQVVSAVAGQSWPLEPKEVREMYEEYARIERDNHAKAHPEYKFSPSKIGPVARARMRAEGREMEDSDDGDVVESDSDGASEDEYRPARRGRDRGRGAGRNRTSSPSRNGRGRSRLPHHGEDRTSTPVGNARNAGALPMTPPSQIAHNYSSTFDGSPQVAPFQLPQSWMVTTHNSAYTSSPNARGTAYLDEVGGGNGGSYGEYSSYDFSHHNHGVDGGIYGADMQAHQQQQQEYALMQARAQYQAMQLQQMQQQQQQQGQMLFHPDLHQQQRDGSSYTINDNLHALTDTQQQPYYTYAPTDSHTYPVGANTAALDMGLVGLPGTEAQYLPAQPQIQHSASSHHSHHSHHSHTNPNQHQQHQHQHQNQHERQEENPFLSLTAQNLQHNLLHSSHQSQSRGLHSSHHSHQSHRSHSQQAQQAEQAESLYPPIDTIPRHYHGNGGGGDELHLSWHSHHSMPQGNEMLDPALFEPGMTVEQGRDREEEEEKDLFGDFEHDEEVARGSKGEGGGEEGHGVSGHGDGGSRGGGNGGGEMRGGGHGDDSLWGGAFD